MNADLLTIDNMLFGFTGTYPGPSKFEATGQGGKFHLDTDDNKTQLNSSELSTTDNINQEAGNKYVSKSRDEFHHEIRKKNESEHSIETTTPTKPKEQSKASENNERPDLVQNGQAEQNAAAPQNKEDSHGNIKEEAGNPPARMIAGLKAYKSSKSSETKLTSTSTEQNGLKAVVAGINKDTPAGKTPPGTLNTNDKIPVSAKTADGTKENAQKTTIKELAPDITSKSGGQTTATTEKTPAANPGLQTIQPKVIDTLSKSTGIDAKKAATAAEPDTKTTTSQTLSNSLNTNGKQSTNEGNDLPQNPAIQRLNMTAVHTDAGQSKGRDTLTSDKNLSRGLEQILSHNNSQTSMAEQISASAKNASTTNLQAQNSSGDVSADIGKQILESIQRSLSQQGTDRQITVRLNPPELGKVFIKFQQQGSELTGQLEVSKTQTRFEIEQTLPQILRNLADSGINVRRLDVTLSNEHQPGQNAFGNQSLQSGDTQQQYSANQGTPGNDPDTDQSNEWWASNNGYENISELQDTLITDGSINLLI